MKREARLNGRASRVLCLLGFRSRAARGRPERPALPRLYRALPVQLLQGLTQPIPAELIFVQLVIPALFGHERLVAALL